MLISTVYGYLLKKAIERPERERKEACQPPVVRSVEERRDRAEIPSE